MAVFDKLIASMKKLRNSTAVQSAPQIGGLQSGQAYLAYSDYYTYSTDAVRQASRRAYYSNPYARAIIETIADGVCGSGMRLEASTDYQDDVEAAAFAQAAERLWRLHGASSRMHTLQSKTIAELQRDYFINYLVDGEVFVVFSYTAAGSGVPFSMRIVASDAVCGGDYAAARARGMTLVNGIEYDFVGVETGYWIAQANSSSVYVPAINPVTGERQVVHEIHSVNDAHARGLPLLLPVLGELDRLRQYFTAEQTRASVQASMALFVKGGIIPPSAPGAGVANPASYVQPGIDWGGIDVDGLINNPGITVQNMPADMDIVSVKNDAPNPNFGPFVKEVLTSITAALGVPSSVVLKAFLSTYSASRAEILVYWQYVERMRVPVAKMLTIAYRNFCIAANITGFLAFPESTQFRRNDAYARDRLMRASWIGAARPELDLKKMASAVIAQIDAGLMTRNQAAMLLNGTEYQDIVTRLRDENIALADALAPLRDIAAECDPEDLEDDNDIVDQRGA